MKGVGRNKLDDKEIMRTLKLLDEFRELNRLKWRTHQGDKPHYPSAMLRAFCEQTWGDSDAASMKRIRQAIDWRLWRERHDYQRHAFRYCGPRGR